jgi:polysaccharide pyruvyl transferase WcaK-like protein
VVFKPIDVHSLEIDARMVEEINAMADMVLVGGGGLIHSVGRDKLLNPIPERDAWMLRLPDELVSQIQVPLVLFALGFNEFRRDAGLHPDILRNLQLIKAHALDFTTRTDTSRERLAALGIDLKELPDPGFFLDGDYPRPEADPYAVVQLAGDAVDQRRITDEFVDEMAVLCDHLASRGLKLVFAPHCRPDIDLCQRVQARMERTGSVSTWEFFEMLRDESVHKGLAFYKHAELVVAMRGHAQIIPFGMSVPAVTITNHPKHMGLLRKSGLGLEETAVDADSRELARAAVGLVDRILEDREGFVRVLHRLRGDLNEQISRHLGPLGEEIAKRHRMR